MARGGIVALAMVLAVACGGESRRQSAGATMASGTGDAGGTGGLGGVAASAGGLGGVAASAGGADAAKGGYVASGGQAATAGGAEGGEGATAGEPECVADDECLAVWDTHLAMTNCYLPTPASLAAAEGDPCLIPWLPNPRCSLPEPMPSCVVPLDLLPDAPIHSCPASPACVTPRCVDGSCTIDWQSCVPMQDDRDCETLRTEFVALLELGRACDPAEDPPSCTGNLADTCGCALPYDFDGPYGRDIWCAFEAWRDDCEIVDCGHDTCTTGGDAVCRANGDGTGTCEYPGPQ